MVVVVVNNHADMFCFIYPGLDISVSKISVTTLSLDNPQKTLSNGFHTDYFLLKK